MGTRKVPSSTGLLLTCSGKILAAPSTHRACTVTALLSPTHLPPQGHGGGPTGTPSCPKARWYLCPARSSPTVKPDFCGRGSGLRVPRGLWEGHRKGRPQEEGPSHTGGPHQGGSPDTPAPTLLRSQAWSHSTQKALHKTLSSAPGAHGLLQEPSSHLGRPSSCPTPACEAPL